MAQEILVSDTLTKEMIDAGARLLPDIEKSDLKIDVAFWLYFPEAEEWRLVLVSPRVDEVGPLKLYSELSNLLYRGDDRPYGLDLRNVSFFSPKETLVRAIAGVSQLFDLSGKRLTNSGFNGLYVEDIYIYYIKEGIEPITGPRYFSK